MGRLLVLSCWRATMQQHNTRPQFQSVLAGSSVAKTTHFALHRNALDARAVQTPPGGAADAPLLFKVADMWIGAMVPKRWAKRAVTRNAIKRQIYTVSTDFAQQYPGPRLWFDCGVLIRVRNLSAPVPSSSGRPCAPKYRP